MTAQEEGNLFAQKVGENIRMYRLRRGLKISELAEYGMLDEKNINRIELGERTPNLDTISKISIVLQVELDDLVEGALEYLETLPEEYWK